jgi:hypothetical protein
MGDGCRKGVNGDRCSQKLNEVGFRQYILINKKDISTVLTKNLQKLGNDKQTII